MKRIIFLFALTVALGVSPATAQDADLETIDTTIDPTQVGAAFSVSVTVRNNGPNNISGDMNITVDIDEPSKPGPDDVLAGPPCSGSLDEDFAVNINPGGTTTVTFSAQVSACSSQLIQATAISTVPAGFNDTNAANDTLVTVIARTSVVPFLSKWGLMLLFLLLSVSGIVWARRRETA